MTPADRAYELINGFRLTQLVYAAAELHLPDLLAVKPCSAAELSSATGVDAGRMRRLLRALTAVGMVRELDGGFSNTEVGELFRQDMPGSRRANLRMLVPESYRNWEHLLETLRTGVTGQSIAHGATLWQLIERDPDFGARFNDAMMVNSEHVFAFVAAAGDFSGASIVVDVGGGEGSLVAGVLAAHPELRGVVYDLAAGLAQTRAYLEAHGVADRCDIVEGSFFNSVPAGDVYLLKDILHDWADDEAAQILRVCRRAMKARSRLMVVERMAPSKVEATPDHVMATLIDLQMMVQLGGKERTVDEFGYLFESAGLKLDRFTPGGAWQLVEAVPS